MFQNRHGVGRQGRNAMVCMALFSALALQVGCSAEEETAQAKAKAVTPGASVESGASTKLAPLSEQDITGAKLPGELVCSFSVAGNAYLHVAGNVASTADAQGVAKLGDRVEAIQAPDGFDGMLHGTTFKGDRLAIEVKLNGDAEGGGGGESPHHAATATYLLEDNPSRTLEGRWQCGP